ncbi:MAG TPA: LEPR-XLL domain-containing protein, partial [Hellea balneolensis]|nr:LEPR-XLL domain-containing protein [Hellea balneolensis]
MRRFNLESGISSCVYGPAILAGSFRRPGIYCRRHPSSFLSSKGDQMSKSKPNDTKVSKSDLINSAARRPLGLLSLEPRILLDAAGAVTIAEGVAESLSQQHGEAAAQDLFAPVSEHIGDAANVRHSAEPGLLAHLQTLDHLGAGVSDVSVTATEVHKLVVSEVNEIEKPVIAETLEVGKPAVYEPVSVGKPAVFEPADIVKPVIYEDLETQNLQTGESAGLVANGDLSAYLSLALSSQDLDSPSVENIFESRHVNRSVSEIVGTDFTQRFVEPNTDTILENFDLDDLALGIQTDSVASGPQIVFVDTSVANYRDIVASFGDDVEVVLIG